jgi:hypothetical protein
MKVDDDDASTPRISERDSSKRSSFFNTSFSMESLKRLSGAFISYFGGQQSNASSPSTPANQPSAPPAKGSADPAARPASRSAASASLANTIAPAEHERYPVKGKAPVAIQPAPHHRVQPAPAAEAGFRSLGDDFDPLAESQLASKSSQQPTQSFQPRNQDGSEKPQKISITSLLNNVLSGPPPPPPAPVRSPQAIAPVQPTQPSPIAIAPYQNKKRPSNNSISSGPKRKRRNTKGDDSAPSPTTMRKSQLLAGGVRPFPCPLAIYGCAATFATKNEWKRHISTQHIKLGFWRCDLCPPSQDAQLTSTYYNDFNRKDLFTQHLRRMHTAHGVNSTHATSKGKPSQASAGADHGADVNGKADGAKFAADENGIPPVSEETMPVHQERCFRKIRDPPPQSNCLFCTRTFHGYGAWNERLEHVGLHFEKEGFGSRGKDTWNRDPVLEAWLEREGMIEKDAAGHWRLGDGVPKRSATEDDDVEMEDAQEKKTVVKKEVTEQKGSVKSS